MPEEPEIDPLLGRLLDRYEILELIATGGLGRVYRARHTGLDRDFALKVLASHVAADPEIVARMRREARATGRIQHPNVVDITDFGTAPDGTTFLVMELLPGRTLERVLREGRLAPKRAAEIARQIALGLDAVHARGFVHRDLKPSNVMLSVEDGAERAKLLDFGLVGIVGAEEGTVEKLTKTGLTLGTPLYMAPEQLVSSRVDHRADLYSLGVILFEMLEGKPPFTGPKVVRDHLHAPPPTLRPSLGLERLAAWLLEKLPDQRPQSAKVVAKTLAGILAPGGSDEVVVEPEALSYDDVTVRASDDPDPTLPEGVLPRRRDR